MGEKVNRLIQKAKTDEQRCDRLLEEMAVMEAEIQSLRKQLQEARNAAFGDAAAYLDSRADYLAVAPYQSICRQEIQRRYREDATAIRSMKGEAK